MNATEGQLWGLSVGPADPNAWAEKGVNEREAKDLSARQLGGVYDERRRGAWVAVVGGEITGREETVGRKTRRKARSEGTTGHHGYGELSGVLDRA